MVLCGSWEICSSANITQSTILVKTESDTPLPFKQHVVSHSNTRWGIYGIEPCVFVAQYAIKTKATLKKILRYFLITTRYYYYYNRPVLGFDYVFLRKTLYRFLKSPPNVLLWHLNLVTWRDEEYFRLQILSVHYSLMLILQISIS